MNGLVPVSLDNVNCSSVTNRCVCSWSDKPTASLGWYQRFPLQWKQIAKSGLS